MGNAQPRKRQFLVHVRKDDTRKGKVGRQDGRVLVAGTVGIVDTLPALI